MQGLMGAKSGSGHLRSIRVRGQNVARLRLVPVALLAGSTMAGSLPHRLRLPLPQGSEGARQ